MYRSLPLQRKKRRTSAGTWKIIGCGHMNSFVSGLKRSKTCCQAAEKLREVGEEEVAEQLERREGEPARAFGLGEQKGLSWWPFQDRPWQYTAHTFGYLAPVAFGSGPQPVRYVEDVKVDPNNTLRGERIKLTLNRLRIAAYPGGGMHRVLLHCYVQNQTPGKAQPLHFNATYRA